MAKTEILKILDKKVIVLDGVKVEVELRMIKDCWGEIVFKPHARFNHLVNSPIQVLKEKYKTKTQKDALLKQSETEGQRK